jgi:hypothetical protein
VNRSIAVLLFAIVTAVAAEEVEKLPSGWSKIMAGGSTDLSAYSVSVDHSTAYNGTASVRIALRKAAAPGAGGIGQAIKADDYRGKRVRVSVHVMATNVSGSAILWVRGDDASGNVVTFDNTYAAERAVRGSTGWVERFVVLDIPANAAALHYGVGLSGSGEIRVDAMRIDVVDRHVSVTAVGNTTPGSIGPPLESLPVAPTNLDFEL